MSHESGRFELHARRTRSTASGGLDGPEWTLLFVHRIENRYTASRPLGRVTTRETAVRALVSAMETVNAALAESAFGDPPALGALVNVIKRNNRFFFLPEDGTERSESDDPPRKAE